MRAGGLGLGVGRTRGRVRRATAVEVEATPTFTVSSAQPGYTGYSGDGSGMRDGVFSGATPASIWGSNTNGTTGVPEWIRADLGSVQTVTQIKVWPLTSGTAGGFGASHLNGSLVQISSDGTSWTTVGTVSGAADNTAATVAINASARYVRISDETDYVSCGDFRVYVSSGGGGGP